MERELIEAFSSVEDDEWAQRGSGGTGVSVSSLWGVPERRESRTPTTVQKGDWGN